MKGIGNERAVAHILRQRREKEAIAIDEYCKNLPNNVETGEEEEDAGPVMSLKKTTQRMLQKEKICEHSLRHLAKKAGEAHRTGAIDEYRRIVAKFESLFETYKEGGDDSK